MRQSGHPGQRAALISPCYIVASRICQIQAQQMHVGLICKISSFTANPHIFNASSSRLLVSSFTMILASSSSILPCRVSPSFLFFPGFLETLAAANAIAQHQGSKLPAGVPAGCHPLTASLLNKTGAFICQHSRAAALWGSRSNVIREKRASAQTHSGFSTQAVLHKAEHQSNSCRLGRMVAVLRDHRE
jgi:hypothetical protein